MFKKIKKGSSRTQDSSTSDSGAQPMYKDETPVCTIVVEPANDEPVESKQEDSRTVDITIPGISKILDKNYNWCGKVIWILALVASLMMCIYQTTTLLAMYFRYAVNVDVSVSRKLTITVPAFTICPGLLSVSFADALNETVSNAIKKRTGPPVQHMNFPFEKLNVTLEQLWDEYSIPEAAIKTLTPCGTVALLDPHTNSTTPEHEIDSCVEYTNFEMKTHYLRTFWGTCLVLEPVQTRLEYQGPDTYIKIIINDTMIKAANISPGVGRETRLRFSDILFWLHNPDDVHRHDTVFLADKFTRNYMTEIRFETKEYNFLNRSDQLCYDTNSISECKNQCYDKCLDRKLFCSLPFMESELPPCSNFNEAVNAYKRIDDFYDRDLQRCKCTCKRPCKTDIHTMSTDVMFRLDPNTTVFYLYYPDNLFHIYTENYVYGMAELLSDLVANVSFYLGFCALTFIQILEICFHRKCDRKKEK